MKRCMTKKVAVVVVAAGLVFGGGGIAFAYFTSGGGGTGQASVGQTGSDDFVVTSTWPDSTQLYPGADGVPFTISVQNTGSGDEHVSYVDVAVATDPADTGWAMDHGTPIEGCDASWFTVTSGVTVNSTLSAGAYDRDIAAASISMADDGNQDPCQNHSIDMTFTVTNGV
jgi:hypothetical protein